MARHLDNLNSIGHRGTRKIDDLRRPEPSRRERQILERLAVGKTDRQIAKDLGLTNGTVKVYITHLRHKFPGFKRYTACAMLAEEQRRLQAIKYSRWYGKWGYQLSPEAQKELQQILGECLASLFQRFG